MGATKKITGIKPVLRLERNVFNNFDCFDVQLNNSVTPYEDKKTERLQLL